MSDSPRKAPAGGLPSISVVVPAFNQPALLARCLDALAASTTPFELIVVDDASTDPTALEVMRKANGSYMRMEQNGGPAVARNAGARKARGEIVVFIDSDVVVTPQTIGALARVLADEHDVAACFGSYDEEPDARSFVSTYRNLLHHYVHQTGPRDASTFWAGCGAIRRDIFVDVGGYDERYRKPSIEDIELGMRLCAAGHAIRLAPSIQVKHLKRWTLGEMVRVDVRQRALPWTHLLCERTGVRRDLNLSRAQQVCAALVFLALAALPASIAAALLGASAWWLAAPLVLLAPVIWINRGFYRLLARVRGALFLLAGVALHLLYYVYAGLAYAYARATHVRGRDIA